MLLTWINAFRSIILGGYGQHGYLRMNGLRSIHVVRVNMGNGEWLAKDC